MGAPFDGTGVFKKNLPKHITDKSKTFEVLF